MTLAGKIFAEGRALPETQARRRERQAALAELARYRGRFKAEKSSRAELYDRASLGLTPTP
jgi:hypothetical protein